MSTIVKTLEERIAELEAKVTLAETEALGYVQTKWQTVSYAFHTALGHAHTLARTAGWASFAALALKVFNHIV
jgi:hypothetical protein